jgi:hypothetical protein
VSVSEAADGSFMLTTDAERKAVLSAGESMAMSPESDELPLVGKDGGGGVCSSFSSLCQ